MTKTLEEATAAIRAAVVERMAGTPADDPKMVGYVPPADGCCDGGRCTNAYSLADFGSPTVAAPPVDIRQVTVAEQTLRAALEAVRDRHGKYGPPNEHFGRTAALVNAAFGTTFTASDWALVMVLDKVARLRGPTPTTDGGVDIAGYGGCYEECRQS